MYDKLIVDLPLIFHSPTPTPKYTKGLGPRLLGPGVSSRFSLKSSSFGLSEIHWGTS